MSKKYLIIIPAYNEEMNIAEVLRNVKREVYDLNGDILVINDGSIDRTSQIAAEEGVMVINIISNLGNGGAVQTGFRYAFKSGYEYIIIFDADGQHDVGYIRELINYSEKNPQYDMVIGSRYLKKTKIKFRNPREIGTRIFSWIASKLIKAKITDCTSGFRIISRRGFEFLSKDINYPQQYPDADFIVMFGRAGYKIGEYPVIMHERKSGISMHTGVIHAAGYVLKMIISIFVAL